MAEWQVQEIVSDSRFHKTTNKNTSWTLNIRQKKQTGRHGNCWYWHFKKSIEPSEMPAVTVASASQMKPPQNGEGSRHHPILCVFWGTALALSPVHLPIPLRLCQGAFWVIVKFLTLLLWNMWVFTSSLWCLIRRVVFLFGNNLDLNGTRMYAAVTYSSMASSLISSWVRMDNTKVGQAETTHCVVNTVLT